MIGHLPTNQVHLPVFFPLSVTFQPQQPGIFFPQHMTPAPPYSGINLSAASPKKHCQAKVAKQELLNVPHSPASFSLSHHFFLFYITMRSIFKYLILLFYFLLFTYEDKLFQSRDLILFLEIKTRTHHIV